MSDIDLMYIISIFIYAVLPFGCLKYFTTSNTRDDFARSKKHENQKMIELMKLRNEMHFLNSDFNLKYAEAMKGEYKKKSE